MSDVEDASRYRWAVALLGDDHDLERLAEHFTGGIRVARGPDGWELRADQFEEMSEGADVSGEARALVTRLRALLLLKFGSTRPLEMGLVSERLADGTRRQGAYGIGAMIAPGPTCSGRGTVTYPDGTVPEAPPIQSWEPILERVATDDRVRAAFDFLSLPPTWSTLSAALDVPMEDPRTGGGQGVVDRGASKGEIERFVGTASNQKTLGTAARHGYSRKPHPDPMNLGEATTLVRGIVDAWIEKLISGRGS
jgi:hypothetical protein